MIINLNNTVRNSRLQGLRAALEVGYPLVSTLDIYSSTIPATTSSPPNGVLLVSVLLLNPVGSIAGNRLTLSLPPLSVITTSGTAGYGRFKDHTGVVVADADLSTAEGTTVIVLSSVLLVAGANVLLISATFDD